jgi:hypothetical protein
MGKYIRVFIAIMMLLGLVLLGRNKAAWAANPETKAGSSVEAQSQPSAPLHSDDDCDKDNNRDKDKCKEKDKDKCKDKDHDDCGSVRPPDNDIDVCEQGNYSVGGVAVLDVDKLQDRSVKDDCFRAHSEDSRDVNELPKNAGRVLSDLVTLTSVGQGSNIKICFAAIPGKKVKIYFSGTGSWKPVGTQVKNGIACAHVSSSGSFILAGK